MGRKQDAINHIMNYLMIHNVDSKKILELGSSSPRKSISSCFIRLDVLQERLPNIVSDINDGLPVKRNSLQAIVGIDIIEHITNTKKFMQECYDSLMINGVICFFIPSALYLGYEIKNVKQYGHKHNWSSKDFQALMIQWNYFTNFKCYNAGDSWFFILEGIKC